MSNVSRLSQLRRISGDKKIINQDVLQDVIDVINDPVISGQAALFTDSGQVSIDWGQ
jgi:hypothetical protein